MDIHARIVDLIDSGRRFCVAVVLSAQGSTPREAGVKAIVDEDGRITGTVGGGIVEAETRRAGTEVCRSGQPAILEVELEGASAGDREPICGGNMRVLVDPTGAKDRAAYASAADARRGRRRGILLTAVRTGPTVETQVSWHPEGEVAAAEKLGALVDRETAQECLADGDARLVTLGDVAQGNAMQVLVEPVIPNPLLLIAGGGHVGQALAAQAALIGFDIAVIDDRPEFTDRALFPNGAKTLCGDIAAGLAEYPTGEDTYIVIVTRGHQHDAEALKACIRKATAYIGMIGSRRKVALVRQSLLESGAATEAELDVVHAPIGLDIGAETVPEIATSIAAQLIAVRRQGARDSAPRDMRDR